MPQKMELETYVTRLKFVFLNIKKYEGGGELFWKNLDIGIRLKH